MTSLYRDSLYLGSTNCAFFQFRCLLKKFNCLRPPAKCNDDFKAIYSKRKLKGKLYTKWMNGVVSKKEEFRPGIKSVDKIIAACVKF